MGLIADECPHCNRVTRCLVIERSRSVGGLIFGIPFVIPLSSTSCVCGECGQEFRSRSAAESRAVAPEVASGLDTDALLGLTNPDLRQARAMAVLRTDPQLRDAFLLMDKLSPGPLRFGLQAALARWPTLREPDKADLIGRVQACSQAEEFARAMAGRYTIGAVGCLAGVAVAAGVWVAAWLLFDGLGILAWVLVTVLGLVAGGVPYSFLSAARDRKWVQEVLLPEADRSGVTPEWVLAVIEKTAAPRGARDELGALRDVGPALRAELAAEGRGPGSEVAGFGQPPDGHRLPGVRSQGPGVG
jgi:hypothetical protein